MPLAPQHPVAMMLKRYTPLALRILRIDRGTKPCYDSTLTTPLIKIHPVEQPSWLWHQPGYGSPKRPIHLSLRCFYPIGSPEPSCTSAKSCFVATSNDQPPAWPPAVVVNPKQPHNLVNSPVCVENPPLIAGFPRENSHFFNSTLVYERVLPDHRLV